MCRAYGQRPSRVVGIQDPEVAFDFDLAMYMVHKLERDSLVATMTQEGADPTMILVRMLLMQD